MSTAVVTPASVPTGVASDGSLRFGQGLRAVAEGAGIGALSILTGMAVGAGVDALSGGAVAATASDGLFGSKLFGTPVTYGDFTGTAIAAGGVAYGATRASMRIWELTTTERAALMTTVTGWLKQGQEKCAQALAWVRDQFEKIKASALGYWEKALALLGLTKPLQEAAEKMPAGPEKTAVESQAREQANEMQSLIAKTKETIGEVKASIAAVEETAVDKALRLKKESLTAIAALQPLESAVFMDKIDTQGIKAEAARVQVDFDKKMAIGMEEVGRRAAEEQRLVSGFAKLDAETGFDTDAVVKGLRAKRI